MGNVSFWTLAGASTLSGLTPHPLRAKRNGRHVNTNNIGVADFSAFIVFSSSMYLGYFKFISYDISCIYVSWNGEKENPKLFEHIILRAICTILK